MAHATRLGTASQAVLHRCQAFRVAQKKHKGADGESYAKGDVIAITDCNVTGTDIGTPIKPKFALKNLWQHILIPALERLVAPYPTLQCSPRFLRRGCRHSTREGGCCGGTRYFNCAGCEFCILLSYFYAYCYSLRSLLYTPCCCLVWPV